MKAEKAKRAQERHRGRIDAIDDAQQLAFFGGGVVARRSYSAAGEPRA